MENPDQEAFEEWALRPGQEFNLSKSERGDYNEPLTTLSWWAFKAGVEHGKQNSVTEKNETKESS